MAESQIILSVSERASNGGVEGSSLQSRTAMNYLSFHTDLHTHIKEQGICGVITWVGLQSAAGRAGTFTSST